MDDLGPLLKKRGIVVESSEGEISHFPYESDDQIVFRLKHIIAGCQDGGYLLREWGDGSHGSTITLVRPWNLQWVTVRVVRRDAE